MTQLNMPCLKPYMQQADAYQHEKSGLAAYIDGAEDTNKDTTLMGSTDMEVVNERLPGLPVSARKNFSILQHDISNLMELTDQKVIKGQTYFVYLDCQKTTHYFTEAEHEALTYDTALDCILGQLSLIPVRQYWFLEDRPTFRMRNILMPTQTYCPLVSLTSDGTAQIIGQQQLSQMCIIVRAGTIRTHASRISLMYFFNIIDYTINIHVENCSDFPEVCFLDSIHISNKDHEHIPILNLNDYSVSTVPLNKITQDTQIERALIYNIYPKIGEQKENEPRRIHLRGKLLALAVRQ